MGWFPKQGVKESVAHHRQGAARWCSKGAQVKALQSLLADLGLYHQDPDGVFGYLTEDAVQALQRRFGLRVDGIAGPMVHRLLHHPILPRAWIFTGSWVPCRNQSPGCIPWILARRRP